MRRGLGWGWGVEDPTLAAVARRCGERLRLTAAEYTEGTVEPDSDGTFRTIAMTPLAGGHQFTVLVYNVHERAMLGVTLEDRTGDEEWYLLIALIEKCGGAVFLTHAEWRPDPACKPAAGRGFEPDPGPTVIVLPRTSSGADVQAPPTTAVRARREDLKNRAADLFGGRPPHYVPEGAERRHVDRPSLAHLPQVTLFPLSGLDTNGPPPAVLVDEAAATALLIDDLRAVAGRDTVLVTCVPLTAARAELLAEVRSEYVDPPERITAQLGIRPEGAHLLSTAGWSVTEVSELTAHLRIETPDDARAVAGRTPFWWAASGWAWTRNGRDAAVPAAVDAVKLAAAGVGARTYSQLRGTGRQTIAEVLTAAPPAIPDEATRILLQHTDPYGDRYPVVYTDPAAARAALIPQPELWRDDRVESAIGPRPVHVTERWSYWSDGRLFVGHTQGPEPASLAQWRTPWPTKLPQAAAEAIDLIVGAVNRSTGTDLWRPLLRATAHTQEIVSQGQKCVEDNGATTTDWTVVRHTFTLPGGSTRELWQRTASWHAAPDWYDAMTPTSGNGYAVYGTPAEAHADV